MARQIIAIDIDDVLAAGSEGFAEFSNQRWGTQLTGEDYNEDLKVSWGVDLEEALRRVDEYLASGVHGRYRRFDDAVAVLERLAGRYDLITITSRRAILKPETDAWLERHFPSAFKNTVYAGFFDNHQKEDVEARLKQTKAGLLKELKASYLIDDQPKHCFGAAEVGVTSLLFGDYRWNRDIAHLPPGVVRAKTWEDVSRYFNV